MKSLVLGMWNSTRNSNANLDTVTPGTALTSLKKETLQIYYNRFGVEKFTQNKPKAFFRGPLTKRMRKKGYP